MIIGIDLGRAKTGIAASEGSIATPLKTITHKSLKELVTSVIRITEVEKVDKIVVGFAPGKGEKYFAKFARSIKDLNEKLEVILWDETLTTRQARQTMIKQGIPKMKRKAKEHEIAASIILQNYLDSQND